jgi:DNA-binding response OmpR family regulator
MKVNGHDALRVAALSAPPAHDPPRVVVAEDDDDMRRLVVEALRKDGYDVSAVSDGGGLFVSLGREILGHGEVSTDLVVADVRMPVCTGIQILRELRSAQCFVPVILMTAFGDETTREHASTLGALLFDKPFELGDLRAAVALLLRRAR